MSIIKNIEQLKKNLLQDEKLTLVAVTKYSTNEEVLIAYKTGLKNFGENRLDSLEDKMTYFERQKIKDISWHFIGELQSNKIKKLLSLSGLKAIHSIYKVKQLKEIKKHLQSENGPLKIFFQVNTSGESEKSGVKDFPELLALYDSFEELNCKELQFTGLMTMATHRTKDYENEAHQCFAKLQSFANRLQNEKKLPGKVHLSMGMSRDYNIALQYGADFIRLGSTIFK